MDETAVRKKDLHKGQKNTLTNLRVFIASLKKFKRHGPNSGQIATVSVHAFAACSSPFDLAFRLEKP